MLTNKIFNASALENPISSAAQQLLCACITADMRSPNTCCASGNQLVGDFNIRCPFSRRRKAGRRAAA